MLMPIWPVLITRSLNRILFACLEICVDTEQDTRSNKEPEINNKELESFIHFIISSAKSPQAYKPWLVMPFKSFETGSDNV